MADPVSLPEMVRRLVPQGVGVTDCGLDRSGSFWRFEVCRGKRKAPLIVSRQVALEATRDPKAMADLLSEAVAKIDDYDGGDIWRPKRNG